MKTPEDWKKEHSVFLANVPNSVIINIQNDATAKRNEEIREWIENNYDEIDRYKSLSYQGLDQFLSTPTLVNPVSAEIAQVEPSIPIREVEEWIKENIIPHRFLELIDAKKLKLFIQSKKK